MIVKLLTGTARSLFLLGCAFAGLAALAMYGSWRCLRAAVAGKKEMPLRDGLFTVMTELATVAHVLREQHLKATEREAARDTARPEPEAWADPEKVPRDVADSEPEGLALHRDLGGEP